VIDKKVPFRMFRYKEQKGQIPCGFLIFFLIEYEAPYLQATTLTKI